MTGQWHFTDKPDAVPTADRHYRWGFSIAGMDGKFSGFLWFKDPRKFGTIQWVPALSDCAGLSKLGPDGLTLHEPKVVFQIIKAAERTRRPIKNFLLDQGILAGVGNIYAAEVLFDAKISPFAQANTLPASKIEEICYRLYTIFKNAIDMGGSSVSDYAGGEYQLYHRVYGREGKGCYECNTKIARIIQSGRSTFYCLKCQGVEINELP